jgi:hypothetical protein
LYNIHIKRRIVKRTNRCVECALQEQFGLKINYTRPGILSNNFKITPKPKNTEKKALGHLKICSAHPIQNVIERKPGGHYEMPSILADQ